MLYFKSNCIFQANDTESTGTEVGTNGFNCKFVNLDLNGKLETVLLENPVGTPLDSVEESFLRLGKNKKKLELFTSKDKKTAVKIGQVSRLAGQTLFL